MPPLPPLDLSAGPSNAESGPIVNDGRYEFGGARIYNNNLPALAVVGVAVAAIAYYVFIRKTAKK